jgi:predicted small secreted protein
MTRALTAATLLAALALSACNTLEGAGQDVKSVGQGVTNGASAVKNGS